MTHKHNFKDEHWTIWHGKIIRFCNDAGCLEYIEKGDNQYSYNAQRQVPCEIEKMLA